MNNVTFDTLIHHLRNSTRQMQPPASAGIIAAYGRNPFLLLIGCILSLRTKDAVSLSASLRLFDQAKTPFSILNTPISVIEQLIYPVGFYRKKAHYIHDICLALTTQYQDQVPSDLQRLLELPGVGRKTANLVLAEGFGIPALCVDTHVHRISNRLGIVTTKNPLETEKALALLLPQHLWIEFSRLLVTWGQNKCTPLSPHCSKCPVSNLCKKIQVTKHR